MQRDTNKRRQTNKLGQPRTPWSPSSQYRQTKEKGKSDKGNGQRRGQRKYSLGWAQPTLLPLGLSSRGPITALVGVLHPTLVSSKNSSTASVALSSHSQRPRVLPSTILADHPPQSPDLGGPGPALNEQVMARLPPAAVAPPSLVELQSLRHGHLLVKEGPDGGVSRQQLAVTNGQRLSGSSQQLPSEAGSTRGAVSALWPDVRGYPLRGGAELVLGRDAGEM